MALVDGARLCSGVLLAFRTNDAKFKLASSGSIMHGSQQHFSATISPKFKKATLMAIRFTARLMMTLGIFTPVLPGFEMRAAQVSAVNVPVSPGVQFDLSGKEGVAPLRIVTSPGHDYLVKIVDSVSAQDVMAVFVTGGVDIEVLVPLGSYGLKYASGEVWQGNTALFGPETNYAKTNDVFDFVENSQDYSSYTVELILQSDGNLVTQNIDASEF